MISGPRPAVPAVLSAASLALRHIHGYLDLVDLAYSLDEFAMLGVSCLHERMLMCFLVSVFVLCLLLSCLGGEGWEHDVRWEFDPFGFWGFSDVRMQGSVSSSHACNVWEWSLPSSVWHHWLTWSINTSMSSWHCHALMSECDRRVQGNPSQKLW